MFTPCALKCCSTSTSPPATCGTVKQMVVRSLPLGCVFWWPITAKRVALEALSWILRSSTFKPLSPAATGQPSAAAPSSTFSAAIWAATVVETVGICAAFGKFFCSQLRHCPSTCGWE